MVLDARVTVDGVTFTPKVGCDNCMGTGVFEVWQGVQCRCHFCTSDAIRRGELDGVADGIEYRGGKQRATLSLDPQ